MGKNWKHYGGKLRTYIRVFHKKTKLVMLVFLYCGAFVIRFDAPFIFSVISFVYKIFVAKLYDFIYPFLSSAPVRLAFRGNS